MLTPRWALNEFNELLNVFRIVAVYGAYRVGKTTLVTEASLPHHRYVSLDDKTQLEAARLAPGKMVERTHGETVVFDEGERALSLVGEMKYQVDRNTARGQYVWVASTQYMSLPGVKESLAGRIGHLRLRGLTEAEQRGVRPGFLTALFDGRFPTTTVYPSEDKAILEAAIRGGFPEVVALPHASDRTAWFESYLKKVILPNVRAQWKTRKTAAFVSVLTAFAHQGALLKKAALATQTAMAWQTIDHYLRMAEAMYLLDRVKPNWFLGAGRFAKSDKCYFSDSGLLAHLLKVRDVEDLLKPTQKAKDARQYLLETWLYNQLVTEVDLQAMWSLEYVGLRTHALDFLISNRRGRAVGIRFVASNTITEADFSHLQWFKKRMDKTAFTGVVLYMGQDVLRDGKGNIALPMSALWDDFTTWEAPQ